MTRYSLFVLFFLLTHFVNSRNLTDFSSSKTSLPESEISNSSLVQATEAVTATISGTTSTCRTANSKITFSGNGGKAPYTFTYNINGGADKFITSLSGNDDITLDVATGVAGVFVYTLTNVTDSALETQSLNEKATVTVNSLPDFSFTYTDNQCTGTGFVFTPSLTGSYSYSWDFGDGTSSTEVNPTHFYTASGNSTQSYFVKLTMTNNLTSCQNTVTNSITTNQLADATLDGSGAGVVINGLPAFSVCSNSISTFTFKNASTTIPTNQHYKISWGDGTPDFESNAWTTTDHTYQIGLWKLTYTVQGAGGCLNIKQYHVFDGSNPAVGLGSPGSTNICISQTLTFPITGTENNPNGTIYTISFNDGSPNEVYTHPAPAQITHKFLRSSCGTSSSDGSTTYQNAFLARIVASNACDKSASTVMPIYVSSAPTADFTMPSPSVCTTNAICFTNSSKNGNAINGGLCSSNSNLIWLITPATGYTLNSGNLGDDFGKTDASLWSSGSNAICPVFTQPGTYTITMKIGNRCDIDQVVKTICVEAPLIPLFSVSGTQGCAPYTVTTTNTTDTSKACAPTYRWTVKYAANYCGTTSGYSFASGTSTTSVSPSFQFSNPGVYTIQLAVTNSCGTKVVSQSVSVTKPPTVSINGIPDFCGTASVNPVAVVNSCAPVSGVLTYAWSFPGGTPVSSTSTSPGPISYAVTGNYTVSLVVTTDCGASAVATKTFTVKPVPSITNTLLAQTICSGFKPDVVTLTADMPAVTYSWSATATAGITGFIASGTSNALPVSPIFNSANTPGTVTYTILPGLNGCVGVAVNYVVTVDPAPVITTQPKSVQVCQGGTSTPLTVAVGNYLGTPSYQWYRNTLNNNTTGTALPGETNTDFTPPIGIVDTLYYYCEITFSAGQCKILTSNAASVNVEPIPVINIQPVPFRLVCIGGTVPVPLTLHYTGGAGATSYQWYSNTTNATTGGTLISGATSLSYTPPVFTSTGTTYYYLQINFSGSACGQIVSDTAKIIAVSDPIVTTHPLITQTLCQTAIPDVLTVAASGGIGLFSYQWYSNSTNITSAGTIIPAATFETFTPPTAIVGSTYYYCLISQPGGPGCAVTSNSSEVIVKPAPTFSTQPASSTVCLGVTPALLSVVTQDGTGTPHYQWYSNLLNSVSVSSPITAATGTTYAPPLGVAGTVYYYCVVTYPSGGCTTLTSAIAQVTINPMPVLATHAITVNSGDTFTEIPNSLAGDIVPTGTTYTWIVPVISPLNAITGFSSKMTPQADISQTLTNSTTAMATATYTVIPTSGTCTGVAFTLIVSVNPPLNPNIILTDVTCYGVHNGAIQTSIQGGVPFKTGDPYLITWTGPAGFTSTAATLSGLYPGNYFLTFSDSVGITFKKTYSIGEPAELIITTDIRNDVTCFGAANGRIAVTVTGGTKPYTNVWTKDALPFSGTNDITNLSPGNYTLTVTDINNCAPRTASFVILEPLIINVARVSQVNVICYGDFTGAVSVDVTGGVPVENIPGVFEYTYAWTGPNGFVSTSKSLTGIAAGIYQLTVSDSRGCSQNFTATITEQKQLVIDAAVIPVTCYGANNASILLTLTGGIPPYQIQWSNLGKGLFQDNLAPDTYTVHITDSAGCTMSRTIIIAEAVFYLKPVVTQISCFGAHDGSIALNIQGGIKPISLTWTDNPAAGNARNQLGPGTYSVTVKDMSSCPITKSFIIVEPAELRLSALVIHAMDCTNPNSGAIKLTVSGGTAPYRYVWTNGKTTQDLTAIQGADYGVTITDSSGCSLDTVFKVIRPLPVTLSVKTVPEFDCQLHTLKELSTAQATGGVPPYLFTWSNGTISGTYHETMETDQPGLIVLGVTDSRGCAASSTFDLIVPVPGIDYQVANCETHTLAFQAVIPNGMEGNYTYLWDFGDGKTETSQNPQHAFAVSGTYNISMTLISATCTSIFKRTITVDTTPVLVLDKLPVFCAGDSLLVHVSGAVSYRWGDGSTAESLLIKQPGDYLVTGTSIQGCSTTYRFTATNFASYNYTIQTDKNEVTVSSPNLQLWSESISYSDYFWDFGDSQTSQGNTQSHTYSILKDGYYDVKLKVVNPNGCIEYATRRIWITDATVGNVFSPAYDMVYMKGFHIQLYNRNGFLLYEGTDGWDGKYKDKPVTNDTYFYVLYLSGESGVKTKTGFVTVVR